LENLSDGGEINRVWKIIKENNRTSAEESLVLHGLKQRKQWFDEECLRFLGQMKQTKMQWVQHQSHSNADNF